MRFPHQNCQSERKQLDDWDSADHEHQTTDMSKANTRWEKQISQAPMSSKNHVCSECMGLLCWSDKRRHLEYLQGLPPPLIDRKNMATFEILNRNTKPDPHEPKVNPTPAWVSLEPWNLRLKPSLFFIDTNLKTFPDRCTKSTDLHLQLTCVSNDYIFEQISVAHSCFWELPGSAKCMCNERTVTIEEGQLQDICFQQLRSVITSTFLMTSPKQKLKMATQYSCVTL